MGDAGMPIVGAAGGVGAPGAVVGGGLPARITMTSTTSMRSGAHSASALPQSVSPDSGCNGLRAAGAAAVN